jgi:hypothetical membrane protein/ketosteroid isomerase-like protein
MIDNATLRERFVFAGLIVTPLLISLILVFGSLEPGYSCIRDMISHLGGFPGRKGILFNLGLVFSGLGLLPFAYSLSYRLGPSGSFSSLLITSGGLGLIGSAVFSCNPGCRNILVEPNLIGNLHSIFFFLSGFSLGAAPLAAFVSYRKQPRLRTMAAISLLVGILANIAGFGFWISFFTTRIFTWEGLLQRLGLFLPLFWIFVAALYYLLQDLRYNQDLQSVIKRELQWAQAHLDLDLAQIEDILSNDFQSFKVNGTQLSKMDLLNSYSSGDRFWEIAHSSDHQVQITGNLAILIGKWQGKGINTGTPFDYTARFISIYQKGNGCWKLILERSQPD